MEEHKFELLVDGVPYLVSVIPFKFNTETRFRVRYNGSKENIFTWDSDIKRIRAIDDDASTLPGTLELAIAQKLESGNF